MLLDFHVWARTRFSLREKRLFQISEFEITGVNCICFSAILNAFSKRGAWRLLVIRDGGNRFYATCVIIEPRPQLGQRRDIPMHYLPFVFIVLILNSFQNITFV